MVSGVSVSVGSDTAPSPYFTGLQPERRMFAKAGFFVAPPVRTSGQALTADVVIVDNLEREHRRRVVFAYNG
jgi:hypothetical protein